LHQLPLGVRIPDRAVFASFLPARNLQAVEHLKRTAHRELPGVTWLCGVNGTGKTHLLQAVCAEAGTAGNVGYFPLVELHRLGVGLLEGLPQLDCLCFDDIEQVVGQLDWERALFGLFREIEERGARLIVSAVAPPALIQWALPDLGSRFTAAAVFQMRPLDELEQQQALQLHAQVRGFELPDDAARWLQRRFPRDMRTLHELLDTLDEAALVAQRRLTVPFIRSVLRE
jgi:DnaA family protein